MIEGALGAMPDPALNPWDLVPTRALIEAVGGVAVVLPSKSPRKFDALSGQPEAAVHRLGGARVSFLTNPQPGVELENLNLKPK